METQLGTLSPSASKRPTHLCHLCQKISFDLLAQDGGFAHYDSFTSLVESSKLCVLCGLIMYALSQRRNVLVNIDLQPFYHVCLRWKKKQPDECRIDVLLKEADRSRLQQLPLVRRKPDWAMLVKRKPFSKNDGSTEQVEINWENPAFGVIPIYVNESDPAVLDGVPWRRILPDTTKSSRSFEVLQKWLDTCLHDHYESSLLHSNPALRFEESEAPQRLVKISVSLQETTWAQLISLELSSQKYATLSYVWGDRPHDWRTTRANVKSRSTAGFNLSELPKTLSDSIALTARLGLEYIWIDSLCIIQDDLEDWAREAMKMRHVYSHSTLNIAADRAVSSHSGLYNTRSQSLEHGFSALVPIATVDESGLIRDICFHFHRNNTVATKFSSYFDSTAGSGYAGSLAPPLCAYKYQSNYGMNPYNWYMQVDQSPLSQRSWAFQERVLSPRTIHFTEGQLFWQCEHVRLSEDNLPTKYWEDVHWQHGLEIAAAKLRKLYLPRQNVQHAIDLASFANTWYNEIVWGYSGAGLSKESDRLVALAGVGKAFQFYRPGARYLAGLWTDCLLQGLTWYILPDDPVTERATREHCEYVAPSWSWASQNLHVYFAYEEYTIWHCEVISYEVKTRSSDPFDQVISGTLILQGRLLQAALDLDSNGRPKRHEIDNTYIIELATEPPTIFNGRFENSLLSPESFRCLFLNHQANMADFIILEQEQDQDAWRRVGHGRALLEPEEIEIAEALHLESQRITIV